MEGKTMNFEAGRLKRTITDDVRQTVREDFPEIADIRDVRLRDGVVEAWAHALCESTFIRARDIPGAGNPGDFELVRGTQVDHIRAVARISTSLADDFKKNFPEVVIDRDIVLAGAIIHDVGKAFEFDPVNLDRWTADPSQAGQPSLRHSVFGAHVCLAVGLPEELAHIALGHSREGQHIGLSLECMFVRLADHSWWDLAAAAGLLKPETMASAQKMTRRRATTLS
jgi:putative nucleotidyltransferase with HDIG domain